MSNIMHFDFQGMQQVRTVLVDGEPWFVAKDVCDALGLEQVSRAMDRVDDDERGLVKVTHPQNPYKTLDVNAVNEPGLYQLILASNKPQAKQFKRWITHEVIPSIRKHGAYITPQKIEDILLNPDTLIQLATQLKQEREARLHLESKVESDKPKVLFAEALETSNSSILIGELAKLLRQNGIDVGQNRLFEILRSEGYLMRTLGERWNDPTQRSMDLGILEIKKRSINNPDGSVRVTKTTKVTVKGQMYFINKFKSLVDAQSEIAATTY